MTEEQPSEVSTPQPINENVDTKKEREPLNWLNIASFAVFLMICVWLMAHDPCETCKVNNISCKEIIQAYADYNKNMTQQLAAVKTGQKFFEYNNVSIELLDQLTNTT